MTSLKKLWYDIFYIIDDVIEKKIVIWYFLLQGGCAVSGTVVMTSYYITNLQTWTLDWSFYTAAVGSGLSFLVFCLYIIYVFLLTFTD